MSINFEGKTALVTGAGSGICREVVIKLLSLGADVVAVSQTQSKLDSLRDELGGNEHLQTISVDLSNWTEAETKLAGICKRVDYLVNGAGYAHNHPVDNVPEEEVDKIIAINLKAPINLIRLVAPGMKERKFGAIVNISSVAGIAALDEHLAYAASKAALDMVTKVSSKELGPYNVRVNSVNPTVVWTNMARQHWSDPKKMSTMVSKIPLGRFVEMNEVVEPIVFLLGEGSAMISGITLPIDGGFAAC